MTRRGLTTIELLLSLALMSTVLTVAGQWIRIAGQMEQSVGNEQEWRRAAGKVLDLIQQDLLVGDLQNDRRLPSPVDVRDNTLLLRTRETGAGLVVHVYAHDNSRSSLVRYRDKSKRDTTRVILDHVKSFQIQHDEEERVLDVKMYSVEGVHVERRFDLS